MSGEKKDSQEPKKKGKKGLIIALAAVLLLGGGGGAAWYFMKPKPDAEADAERAPAAKKKTFSALEPFTVNLADEGGERFAQVAIVLEVADAKTGEQLTAVMPAVRNAVLMLLSSKTSRELLTVAGKEELAGELAIAAGMQIGWKPPDADGNERPRRKAAVATPGGKSGSARSEDADADSDDGEEADEERASRKKKSKAKRRADPNPIEAVLFSQFIVQ